MNAFAFTWEVATDGYQLVNARIGTVTSDMLTNDLPIGGKYKARVIEPLERPTLFREFADLDTSASILRFANLHGKLGLPPRAATTAPDQFGNTFAIRGELVGDWQRQAKNLKATIGLWKQGRIKIVAEGVRPFLDAVSPRFTISDRGAALQYAPHHLLAAIWLQFALAMQANKDFRRCGNAGCGAWIEAGPLERRTDVSYCSRACRQQAYRERKKRTAK